MLAGVFIGVHQRNGDSYVIKLRMADTWIYYMIIHG